MLRPIPADELNQIVRAVRPRPGIRSAEIADVLGERMPAVMMVQLLRPS
jgi:hypothetical protein